MKEILNQFTTQGTLVQATPVEFQNVLNSEACRGWKYSLISIFFLFSYQLPNPLKYIVDFYSGAVKFGDKLTPQICVALLEGLKLCNLPFQCAHGRPTVIPLVNLEKLKHLEVKVSEENFVRVDVTLN